MGVCMTQKRVLLSWSSGKDSAWSLHVLRQQPSVEVVGLLTTFNEMAERVSMHAVRRSLVEAQAAAAHLPLRQVALPFPCSNAEYEDSMRVAIGRAREEGVTHLAFGDLFLEDIRDYRIRMLSGSGIEPLFPLWCSAADTPVLAREMLSNGLRAVLTCVDPKQLPESFAGRTYDAALLSDLPARSTPVASAESSIPSVSPDRCSRRRSACGWEKLFSAMDFALLI